MNVQIISSGKVNLSGSVTSEKSFMSNITNQDNCINTLKIANFWVGKGEFTAVVKNESQRGKRCFQKQWLESTSGCIIICKSVRLSALFVQITLNQMTRPLD